jgi:hypothetical protein
MAISAYPSVSSGIKSIQSGTTGSAGAITISSVNTSKSFVHSYSNGSSGSIGATGTLNGTLTASGGSMNAGGSSGSDSGGTMPNYVGTRTVSAGATSIVSNEYGVYLTNETTLTATGACVWQVVEYN